VIEYPIYVDEGFRFLANLVVPQNRLADLVSSKLYTRISA
jgi:hypothetical protein